jgi:hypothetical protein
LETKKSGNIISMSPQEQSQPNHIPTLEVVNSAYADIIEHNAKHTGFGAMFRGMIGGLIENAEPIDDENPGAEAADVYKSVGEHMQEGVIEGDMSAELQDMFHSDTFMRIGIKLTPSGSYGVNGLGDKVTSEALSPVLENTELYKDFLDTVSPEQVEMKDGQLLPAVLSDLSHRISLCFDSKQREEIPEEFQEAVEHYGEDALRTFLAIEPEYKRLGLDTSSLRSKYATKPEPTHRDEITEHSHSDGTKYNVRTQHPARSDPAEQEALVKANKEYDVAHRIAGMSDRLEGYVEHWGKGVLPEFITAANGQYLIEPEQQGFGPAQWHYDGGQRYWSSALEFVALLGKDNRTEQFAEEVRAGLVRSLDAAVAEIDGNTDTEPPYFAGQRGDLVNVRNALMGQVFDTKQLEEYTKEPDYGL